jgi:hypothetical protein
MPSLQLARISSPGGDFATFSTGRVGPLARVALTSKDVVIAFAIPGWIGGGGTSNPVGNGAGTHHRLGRVQSW